MVIFRTETFSDCNNSHFRRTFYLYSLIKNKRDVSLVVDNPKTARSNLKKKDIEIFHHEEKNILKEKPLTIIFDLKDIKESDLQLADNAVKNGVNIVQIIEQPQRIIDKAFYIHQDISFTPEKLFRENSLFGPDNIILHNRFIHFNSVEKRYGKKIRRLFLSLNEIFSYREIRDISDNLIRHGFLVKIASGTYLKKFNKKTLKRIYPGIKFTGKRDNLARPFFEADISITPAGLSSYESIATGTPSISLFNSENEKKISLELEKKGVCIAVEKGDILYSKKFIDLIREKFSPDRVKEMGTNGKNLIDGQGIYRVIKTLTEKKFI